MHILIFFSNNVYNTIYFDKNIGFKFNKYRIKKKKKQKLNIMKYVFKLKNFVQKI